MRCVILLFLTLSCSTLADSPPIEVPLVFASEWSSDVFFTMFPAKYEREAYGIAYKVEADGQFKKLYRTKGWYSQKIFISCNGKYLVRIEPLIQGHKPEKNHLAVAFYSNGKLIRKYSTFDLVKDPSKISRTVTYYFWQPPTFIPKEFTEDETNRLRSHLDQSNLFWVRTIDGWTYVFDVTSGVLKEEKRTFENEINPNQ